MPSKYASGKHSIAECDRCGQRYKLVQLKKLTIKTKQVSIKVCPECWEPDQPQLQLGMYPVNDPQAVREPRPDISYYASGVDDLGNISGGSRVFQWGWNPVGGASSFDTVLTPNYLIAVGAVGTVTISTT
jgi:NAD-dependent SIR2 family protein deacetylase